MKKACKDYWEQASKEVFDIDIPVVYVTGIVKEANEFEQCHKLQMCFKNLGYKVGIISNSKIASLLEDGYCCNIKENSIDAILKINHFVKQIENTKSYDLLIVVLISGTGILGRKLVGDFGLEIYCWRRAVPADCIVLNILYGNYTEESLELLGESIQDTLGAEVDFYNIVNQMLDFDESEKRNAIYTWLVDQEFFQKNFLRLKNNKIYALIYDDEIERLRDQIIRRLSKYGEIERI